MNENIEPVPGEVIPPPPTKTMRALLENYYESHCGIPKSRKCFLLSVPTLCIPIGILIFPVNPTEVPLHFGVNTIPLLIFSFLSGILFFPFFMSPNREMESILPRQKMFFLRGIWGILLAISFGIYSTSLVWYLYDANYATIFLRNFILAYSLNLIFQIIINPRLSWIPTTLYAFLIWFVGSTDSIATARVWAIILYQETHSTINYLSAISFISAASLHILKDGKEL